eukprot:SAG31_NODE_47_length_30979_cov_41.708841_34_plen_380_part_00
MLRPKFDAVGTGFICVALCCVALAHVRDRRSAKQLTLLHAALSTEKRHKHNLQVALDELREHNRILQYTKVEDKKTVQALSMNIREARAGLVKALSTPVKTKCSPLSTTSDGKDSGELGGALARYRQQTSQIAPAPTPVTLAPVEESITYSDIKPPDDLILKEFFRAQGFPAYMRRSPSIVRSFEKRSEPNSPQEGLEEMYEVYAEKFGKSPQEHWNESVVKSGKLYVCYSAGPAQDRTLQDTATAACEEDADESDGRIHEEMSASIIDDAAAPWIQYWTVLDKETLRWFEITGQVGSVSSQTRSRTMAEGTALPLGCITSIIPVQPAAGGSGFVRFVFICFSHVRIHLTWSITARLFVRATAVLTFFCLRLWRCTFRN